MNKPWQDRATGESDQGALVAILLEAKARVSALSLIGEINFAWTPAMELGGIRSDPGFVVLPMLGLRAIVPMGERK